MDPASMALGPARSVDPAIENHHWLDLVRGFHDACDRGAGTPLLRDLDGHVDEGPGFDIFAVRDGAPATPAHGVPPGIARRTAMDLCEGP